MTSQAASSHLRVMMVTSEWPTPQSPADVPFIVRQATFLRRAGVDIDVFFFRGAQNPINYAHAWQRLRRKLRDTRYDLVHAQFGQGGIITVPSHLPLVVTFRGDDLEGIIGKDGGYTFGGRCLQYASQLVARIADEVIVVSERLAHFLPKRSYHLIPSGLDLELFRPMPMALARQQLGLPQEKRLVLFAANPAEPRKRYELAQAAVARLQASYSVELIAATGVLHHDIPLYMNACDVMLLPSLHEGSPNVVKEALACNTPVVATDVGDVRERIGGIAGCVVVDGTYEAIATALSSVFEHGGRIDGRSTVLALDEQQLTEQVVNVYEQALRKRKRRYAYG